MSIHDSNLSGQTATPAAAETVDLASLEGLAGLVEDLTNIHMTRTQKNLEQCVRDRLGPNVTLDDARRMMGELTAIN